MTLQPDSTIVAHGRPGDWTGLLLPHVKGRPGLLAAPLAAMQRDGSLPRWINAQTDRAATSSRDHTTAGWLYLLREDSDWLETYRADHPGRWTIVARQQVDIG